MPYTYGERKSKLQNIKDNQRASIRRYYSNFLFSETKKVRELFDTAHLADELGVDYLDKDYDELCKEFNSGHPTVYIQPYNTGNNKPLYELIYECKSEHLTLRENKKGNVLFALRENKEGDILPFCEVNDCVSHDLDELLDKGVEQNILHSLFEDFRKAFDEFEKMCYDNIDRFIDSQPKENLKKYDPCKNEVRER